MRTFRLFGIAVALLATIGCGPEQGKEKPLRYGPGELDHSQLDPVKVRGRVLASGDYLGRPSRIVPSSEHLLVLDNIGDSVLHVISTSDGRRVQSQGRRGRGPGEFEGAWSLSRDPRDANSVWVFDVSLSRLTRIDLARLDRSGSNPEILTLRADLVPVQPLWLSDSVLVSPNFSPRGRLLFLDRAGRLIRSGGEVPTDSRGTPPGVLQQAWTGKLAVMPSGNRMVIATQFADQIEIYDAAGTLVRKVRGPFRFDPRFTVANAGDMQTMASDESMRIGYSDLAVTDEHIYALFSGRTREAFGGGGAPFGRYVHVYDWDGNLVRTLELSTPVISLAISPDHKTLYGTRHDPEPAIMAFDLEG